MIQTPKWRVQPEPVLVNCIDVQEWPSGNDFVVQFQTLAGQFTAFVQKRFVKVEEKALLAAIIADIDGGVLVDIPTETINSGPRLVIRDEERDKVLIFDNWVINHGVK